MRRSVHARQLFCWLILALLLVYGVVFGLLLYHEYHEDYVMCRNQKKVALTITKSQLCTDAYVRDMAKAYNNVDCLHAESQLRIHPRTCALKSVTLRLYASANDNIFSQLHSGFEKVWNTTTSSLALVFVYPLFGVAAYMWLYTQREHTRRYSMDIQSRDKRERQQTEMLEQVMHGMRSMHAAPQPRRLTYHRGPVIEEFESCSDGDDADDDTNDTEYDDDYDNYGEGDGEGEGDAGNGALIDGRDRFHTSRRARS